MDKIRITDLLALDNNKQVGINEQLVDKASSLKVKTISKKKQKQILRQTNYKIVTEDLDKWVGVIKLNRQKDTLNFKQKFIDETRVNFFDQKPQTQLEQKIQKELSKRQIDNATKVINNQQKVLGQITAQEAKKRLIEARKHRTIVFNEEIKRRRIAKIKSKLYRKIKKRQRMREEGKRVLAMEGQQKSQYLQKLTKQRIKERITLKHRTKSKHIQNILRFNKGNKDAYQQSINQLNSIRKSHLQRVQEGLQNISQEYDDQNYRREALADLQAQIDQLENQEQQTIKQKSGINGMKFMKLAKKVNLQKQKKQGYQLIKKLQMQNQDQQLISEQSNQEGAQKKDKIQEQKPKGSDRMKFDKIQEKNGKQVIRQDNIKTNIRDFFLKENQKELVSGLDIQKLKQKYKPQRVQMDLTEVISKNKEIFEGFTNLSAAQNMREFQQQKLVQYEKQVENGQKFLKGWGSWIGPGIQQKKIDPKVQLKKKLAKIEQIKRRRKDGQISYVTINQTRNKQLSQYMVRKLPHDFKSVQQFEYLQNNSIGPQWNTLTQFQDNIKKRIQTNPGVVINPIKLPKKTQLINRKIYQK